jgi:hypothetical protein
MVRLFWPTVGFAPARQSGAAATEYVRDLPGGSPDAPLPVRIVRAADQQDGSQS